MPTTLQNGHRIFNQTITRSYYHDERILKLMSSQMVAGIKGKGKLIREMAFIDKHEPDPARRYSIRGMMGYEPSLMKLNMNKLGLLRINKDVCVFMTLAYFDHMPLMSFHIPDRRNDYRKWYGNVKEKIVPTFPQHIKAYEFTLDLDPVSYSIHNNHKIKDGKIYEKDRIEIIDSYRSGDHHFVKDISGNVYKKNDNLTFQLVKKRVRSDVCLGEFMERLITGKALKGVSREAYRLGKTLIKHDIPHYIKFSGNKGFHVSVPASFMDKIHGYTYPDCTSICRQIARGIKNKMHIHSIDEGIYDGIRLMRLPYSLDNWNIVLPMKQEELRSFDMWDVSLKKYLNSIDLLTERGMQMRNLSGDATALLEKFL